MIQSTPKYSSPKYTRILLLVGLSSFGWQSSAGAQAVITSTNPAVFTAAPGQTLSLNAILKNQFGSSLSFLGDNINFTGAAGPTEVGPATSNLTVAIDDSPFAGTSASPGFPQPLAAGDQRTLSLANIIVGKNATPGTYTGYFTIQGNTDPNGAAADQATQNFQLTVNTAPVPETSMLLSLGLLMTFGAWNLRRMRCKPAAKPD